jgi:glycosyltransferase involved in cell wall biosynthesis
MIQSKKSKLIVVFVGGFNTSIGGPTGGQLFACTTLISSKIQSKIDFICIDTTMESLPPPPLLRRSYKAALRLKHYITTILFNNIDAVLIFSSSGKSFFEKGLMALIAKIFKIRVVFSPRSGFLKENLLASPLMRCFAKCVFKSCDTVLCQSQSWADFYSKLTRNQDKKFHVVKNWLNTSDYITIKPQQKKTKPVIILFLGWIEPEKGIFDLLHAVNLSLFLQKNCKILVCGNGSSLQTAKQFVIKHKLENCIEFKGWVEPKEKKNILRDSSILVLPSHSEGMPNAILEGMASGCCIVATSVGAIPELIQHKKSGILVRKKNPKELSEGLIFVVKHEKERYQFSTNARQVISESHDINNIWPLIYDRLSGKLSKSF